MSAGQDTPAAEAAAELARHREFIDEIDEALVRLLARRFEVTADIGQLKTAAGMEAVDSQREAEHLDRMSEIAREVGLDPEFVQGLLRQVIDEVVRRHNTLND